MRLPGPANALRATRNRALGAGAAGLAQLAGSTTYARAQGAALDLWLTTTIPAARAASRLSSAVLADLNVPLRSDVTTLAGRLTHIELHLDDLDEALAELREQLRTEIAA